MEKQEITGGGTAPTCANGCGYFGSAATKNYCSRCYKDLAGKSAAPVEAATEEKATTAVILCVGGCGFYGSTETKNMCSKCFIDSIKTVGTTPSPLEKIKATLTATEEQPVPAAVEAAVEAPPAAPNRCATCRKKVGLLGFACRCGGTFCSQHRYAEKHACDFDFKKADREQIAKNNPLVVAPKINKI